MFYAGPENYMAPDGLIDFTGREFTWSCVPDVASGDFALMYRKGLGKVSLSDIRRLTGVTAERAKTIKRDVGSDIAEIFEIISGPKGPVGPWAETCDIRHLTSIRPALKLIELRADFRLLKWDDLRWNFQSQGRDALKIPEFACDVIDGMISGRTARQINLVR